MTFNVFGLLKIYGNHFSYMAWADTEMSPRDGNVEVGRVVPTQKMLELYQLEKCY